MKNGYRRGICIFLLLALVFSLTGCWRIREKKYYSDINNFITEEAVVDNIIYNEEQRYIVFWLAEIDPSYQATAFIIRSENATLVLERGILGKIRIGDTITFTSAPGCYSNGYFMPIISISVAGEVILDINEGHQNLMNSY